MKGSLILVLISTLVATALFADTITMKNGQTYTGEIVKETKEYIHLKTDTEVLRIPLSDIARMTTPEGEPGTEGQPVLMLTAFDRGQADAEGDVSKVGWFTAGCLLNCLGVAVAYSFKPDPPEDHLVGKSSEYLAAYTKAYRKEARSIQTNQAVAGCIVSSVGCGIYACISLERAKEEAEREAAQECASGVSSGSP